jgi:hypothetical protein
MSLKMGSTNLSFLRSDRDLAKYLQAVFGQCTAVPRKSGKATVVSGTTAIDVADTGILATDIVIATVQTKGANACYIVDTTIVAATKFTITVNTDPGTGGAICAYTVFRPVP